MADRSRAWKLVIALALLAALCGCAVKYAVVRELQFRSEVDRSGRIQLPLSEKSERELLDFLNAHGDRNSMPRAGSVPNGDLNAALKKSVYGSLLQALRDSQNLTIATETPKKFCDAAVKICGQTSVFRGRPAVMDVIDAREPAPVFPYPIAVSDGQFWWIFYHRQVEGKEQLQGLLVTLVPPK
jgi:hypothetical protein